MAATKYVVEDDVYETILDQIDNALSDETAEEMIDCLLVDPNATVNVWLGRNTLTDRSGIKLAQYVASTLTLDQLKLNYNSLGDATFLALAQALRHNWSLRVLFLYGNRPENKELIDAAFVHSLRLNPRRHRCGKHVWKLYVCGQYEDNDYKRLKERADALGHPTLQELLLELYLHDCREITARKHT